MNLYKAALLYAARGWCVLPLHTLTASGACSCKDGAACGRNTAKHPRIQGWQKVPVPTATQITRWWRQWPHANVGLRMGAGLLAVDIECEYLDWLAAHTDLCPPTLTSISGGGGRHLLYQVPLGADFGNWVKHKGLPLDIRTDGGQIVAPPSLHRSKGRYTWLPGHSPLDGDPAPAPAALVALLTRPPPPPRPTRPCDPDAVPFGLLRYARDGKRHGERNKAGYWLACRLVEQVADPNAGRRVLDLYGRRCDPTLDDTELEKMWKSAQQRTAYLANR